jgi:predicted RND superfamily exporter protein
MCATIIVLSILSVSFGVLGFLHFFDATLNPTSMITLSMSVGFSVDFASHITYAFMSIESDDPEQKLSGALRSVGYAFSCYLFLFNCHTFVDGQFCKHHLLSCLG